MSQVPRFVTIDRVKIEVVRNGSARSGGVDVEGNVDHQVRARRGLIAHPVVTGVGAKGRREMRNAGGVRRMIAAEMITLESHRVDRIQAKKVETGPVDARGVAVRASECLKKIWIAPNLIAVRKTVRPKLKANPGREAAAAVHQEKTQVAPHGMIQVAPQEMIRVAAGVVASVIRLMSLMRNWMKRSYAIANEKTRRLTRMPLVHVGDVAGGADEAEGGMRKRQPITIQRRRRTL
ncbi:MAG: hypothetical protein GY894_07840 [Planctomycetes bacterium]|nr:hypothetical protein [Planctomycetota bacterium]